jgi:hypothetical protein
MMSNAMKKNEDGLATKATEFFLWNGFLVVLSVAMVVNWTCEALRQTDKLKGE